MLDNKSNHKYLKKMASESRNLADDFKVLKIKLRGNINRFVFISSYKSTAIT